MLKLVKRMVNINPDGYVSYRWKRGSLLQLLGLENLRLFRALRVNYWARRASQYAPFKPFYDEVVRNKIIEDPAVPVSVREIYKNGTVIKEDFLDSESLKEVKEVVDQIDLPKDTTAGFVQKDLKDLSPTLRQKIIDNLHEFYEHFFPEVHKAKKHDKIYVGVRIDYSNDGVDKSPLTANWHSDRFVPTFNCIYFPFGAKWGAFEKEFGNPCINSRDYDYFLSTRFWLDNNVSTDQREGLYFDTGRETKLLTCKPNTLVAGSHHLQHRRSPYNSAGKRIGIFIDHYNFFTRGYLR